MKASSVSAWAERGTAINTRPASFCERGLWHPARSAREKPRHRPHFDFELGLGEILAESGFDQLVFDLAITPIIRSTLSDHKTTRAMVTGRNHLSSFRKPQDITFGSCRQARYYPALQRRNERWPGQNVRPASSIGSDSPRRPKRVARSLLGQSRRPTQRPRGSFDHCVGAARLAGPTYYVKSAGTV